jgi:hypothetical protein
MGAKGNYPLFFFFFFGWLIGLILQWSFLYWGLILEAFQFLWEKNLGLIFKKKWALSFKKSKKKKLGLIKFFFGPY